jgi:hypothetical protein
LDNRFVGQFSLPEMDRHNFYGDYASLENGKYVSNSEDVFVYDIAQAIFQREVNHNFLGIYFSSSVSSGSHFCGVHERLPRDKLFLIFHKPDEVWVGGNGIICYSDHKIDGTYRKLKSNSLLEKQGPVRMHCRIGTCWDVIYVLLSYKKEALANIIIRPMLKPSVKL